MKNEKREKLKADFLEFPKNVVPKFPTTRYQGSKQKYADWIWHCIRYIPFETALDPFGGTGCIAHLLKQEGKGTKKIAGWIGLSRTSGISGTNINRR